MTSKDTHDPGWNDPPIFTYDKAAAIQAAAANKKGISLNKRVAFPISNNVDSEPKNVKTNLLPSIDSSKPPPMSQPTPLSTSFTTKSDAACEIEGGMESKEMLEKVLENLEIKTNCDEEIVKRIKILEKMWTDGKLEEKVQIKVLELSEALLKGDIDSADTLQKSLMVDHVSQCSSWMSGIRHLINQKKSN